MSWIDIAGQKFGRYTAHWPVGRAHKDDCMKWLCSCDCGNLRYVRVSQLRGGHNRSCGCLRMERLRQNKGAFRHGKSHAVEGFMYYGAKQRARRKGLPFDIDIEDVVVPDTCPLLNISIKKQTGILSASSPTLDRIDSTKGYVKGNVWVISHKANTAKSDLSLAEMQLLCRNLETKCGHISKEPGN